MEVLVISLTIKHSVIASQDGKENSARENSHHVYQIPVLTMDCVKMTTLTISVVAAHKVSIMFYLKIALT